MPDQDQGFGKGPSEATGHCRRGRFGRTRRGPFSGTYRLRRHAAGCCGPLVEITLPHASARGRRVGCRQDAGPMRSSDGPIVPARSTEGRRQSCPRRHRNRVPVGPRGSALRQTSTAVRDLGAGGQLGAPPEGANLEPCPTPPPARQGRADAPRQDDPSALSISAFHDLRGPASQPRKAAPVHCKGGRLAQARRRSASPARVIPPVASRSPGWWREGADPAQGPTFFDEESRTRSAMGARNVMATAASASGMVITRRQTGFS